MPNTPSYGIDVETTLVVVIIVQVDQPRIFEIGVYRLIE